MNRQSLPEEIDAPELNNRGLYVFHGCDSSTSRQLARLAERYSELYQIEHIMNEEATLPASENLYVLTKSKYNQFISHAVMHLGDCGLLLFRFDECSDDDASGLIEIAPKVYTVCNITR